LGIRLYWRGFCPLKLSHDQEERYMICEYICCFLVDRNRIKRKVVVQSPAHFIACGIEIKRPKKQKKKVLKENMNHTNKERLLDPGTSHPIRRCAIIVHRIAHPA